MNTEELTDKMAETTRLMIDSLAELQEISESTVRALAKQQLDAFTGFHTVGTQRIGELAVAATPTELFTIQSKIAAEVAEDLKANALRTMEVLNQGQRDLQTFLGKNIKDFIGKVNL
ncbi:MAG: phasin family protein [Magnetococcales bacterium]|nr:phasin family protein [Magnetococcales bacterium]